MPTAVSPTPRQIARAADAFALAAHPLRLQILCALASRAPQSPSDLSDALGSELSTTSYHFRCLSRAGAVKLQRTAQRRGAIEHYYVLGVLGAKLVELVGSAQVGRRARTG